MRRSILFVLLTALMLTVTVGATASVAAGPVADAPLAARARGRARRRAARCRRGRRAARCRARRRRAAARPLADGLYEDAAKRVRLTVAGAQARLGIAIPRQCEGAGILIGGDGTIRTTGDTTTASGLMSSQSGIRVDWKIVVRSGLTYALDTDYVIQIFGSSSPCVGQDRVTGTLVKR